MGGDRSRGGCDRSRGVFEHILARMGKVGQGWTKVGRSGLF